MGLKPIVSWFLGQHLQHYTKLALFFLLISFHAYSYISRPGKANCIASCFPCPIVLLGSKAFKSKKKMNSCGFFVDCPLCFADELTCSAKLTVWPSRHPLFTRKLESVAVVEGRTARLDCKISGEPPPTIVWTHFGNCLHPAVQRHWITRYSKIRQHGYGGSVNIYGSLSIYLGQAWW